MFNIRKHISVLCRSIVFLLLAPSIAFGVGLGKLQVNSKLGEVLSLELELLSVSPAEIGTMSVELASRSVFARANVLYPEIAELLNFNIVEGGGDTYFVTITSDNPVTETYLHLLISANWSGGKVIREYTALLDPPLYSGGSAAVVEVPSTAGDGEDIYSSDITDTTDSGSISTTTETSSGSFESLATLQVQRGDTLSGIVKSLGRPGTVSMQQGLTAILEANPDAFINGNMNRLIAGASLDIPSFANMALVDNQVARQNFRTQVAEYDQYLSDIGYVASPSVDVEDPDEIEPLISESAKPAVEEEIGDEEITDETDIVDDSAVALAIEEDIAAQGSPEEADVVEEPAQEKEVRLVIGQETSDEELASAISGSEGEDAQFDALRTQLAELDESLLVSGVESEEVKQRLKDIQSQVDRVSRLLEIEDANLAASQDRAVVDEDSDEAIAAIDESGQPDDETISEIEETGSTTESVESDDVSVGESDESNQATAEASESNLTAEEAAESLALADTNAGPESQENVQEETGTTRNVVKTGIMDSVTGLFGSVSDYALKIVAGLLALIAALFFYRRRKSQREYEESMLDIESGQLSGNTNTAQKSFNRLSAASGIDLASHDSGLELTIGGGLSYLSEDGVAGVAEEENEVVQAGAVDPMAEADVYLAYDRDEQAVQVLKEAYAANPERSELAEKLLEIYHKQDDRIAFDSLASDLHSRIGSKQNPVWTKIIAMGKEVSPGNDLYSGISELPDMPIDRDSEQIAAPGIDIPTVNDLAMLNMEDNELSLGSGNSEDTAVKTLDFDDLEISISDESTGTDQVLDAPTLSQIITAAEENERLAQLQQDQSQQDEEEIEFNLGDDDDDDMDEQEVSELATALSELNTQPLDDGIADLEPVVEQTSENIVDQDSYITEASEQSISKLEPYHESETALELAKAYLELGEKDIAKGFIEEVINEGSDKQKAKAEKLVKELVD